MTVMECLGQRLKSVRQREGLTQYALTQRAGVPQATIWKLENGKQKSVSIEIVRRLAKALRTDLDFLVGTHDPEVDRISSQTQHPVPA